MATLEESVLLPPFTGGTQGVDSLRRFPFAKLEFRFGAKLTFSAPISLCPTDRWTRHLATLEESVLLPATTGSTDAEAV